MNISSKFSIFFAVVALACGTGCAAEAGGEDDTNAPAQAESGPATPAHAAPADEAPASPSSEQVRGAQPVHPARPGSGPGDVEGVRDLSAFGRPPQPCPQASDIEVQ